MRLNVFSKVGETHRIYDSEKSSNQANEKPLYHKLLGARWDCFDYPPFERRVILKLDSLILLWGALSSFIKYLDKSNLSNAYNSGMKEYLNVQGNELNYANTAYNVASIICGYPASWLMLRYNTKWFIVIIEVLWTIVTFCTITIKTPFQMIVVRTLLGIIECGHYSAFVFLIVCFLLDILDRVRPNRFISAEEISAEEIQWLKDRKPKICVSSKPIGLINKLKEFGAWLLEWETWAFWLFGIAQDLISLSNQSTQFWIMGWNNIVPNSYSVVQYNTLTSPMYAVAYAFAISLGWISDTLLKGKRWPGIMFTGFWTFAVMIALGKIPVYGSKPVRFFLYYQTSVAEGASGLYWGWSQEYFTHNIRQRAFVCGGINVWAYIANSIVNPIWFQTEDQPFVSTGHYISAFFSGVYVLTALALGLNESRYRKKHDKSDVEDEIEIIVQDLEEKMAKDDSEESSCKVLTNVVHESISKREY